MVVAGIVVFCHDDVFHCGGTHSLPPEGIIVMVDGVGPKRLSVQRLLVFGGDTGQL